MKSGTEWHVFDREWQGLEDDLLLETRPVAMDRGDDKTYVCATETFLSVVILVVYLLEGASGYSLLTFGTQRSVQMPRWKGFIATEDGGCIRIA